MSQYDKSKVYFTQLSNQGNTQATELLEEYEEMRVKNEFLAARFLRDVYIDFQLELQGVRNG
jgi:hypothetical protein